MKIAINTCYGGFGLSDEAYEKLVEYGIPIRKYIEQKRSDDGLYLPEPLNDGEVIFDRDFSEHSKLGDAVRALSGSRYWETWIDKSNRNHPLLIKVIEELGDKANTKFSKLKIVDVPDNVDWEIDDYDGIEQVSEKHKVWL